MGDAASYVKHVSVIVTEATLLAALLSLCKTLDAIIQDVLFVSSMEYKIELLLSIFEVLTVCDTIRHYEFLKRDYSEPPSHARCLGDRTTCAGHSFWGKIGICWSPFRAWGLFDNLAMCAKLTHRLIIPIFIFCRRHIVFEILLPCALHHYFGRPPLLKTPYL